MEYMGFQASMDYLLGCGLEIATLITDRHGSVTKHMREQLPEIIHYFDLWHLKKSKLHVNMLEIQYLQAPLL